MPEDTNISAKGSIQQKAWREKEEEGTITSGKSGFVPATYNAKSFIFLSLGWAYFFWGLNIVLHAGTDSTWGMVLLVAGGISPTVATTILLRSASEKERISFVKSLFCFKGIPLRYWIVVALLPLLILFAAIGLSLIVNSGEPAVSSMVFQPIWNIFSFALLVFIMGPVPEEIGWRGYLLGALQNRYSLLRSSLLLAVVWSFWHIPLFFISNYPLSLMLRQPGQLLAYFVLLFPKSVVYSWLFIKTGRSITAAILFHFFINFYGMIWETSVATQYIELSVWTALSFFLVWKEQKLFQL